MPHVSREFQCPTQTGPNPQSYFTSPFSCSEYFMCVGDVPIKFTCASPLLWDERNNFCEWPNKIQCNKGLKPQRPAVPKPPVPKPRSPVMHQAPQSPVMHQAPQSPVMHQAPQSPVMHQAPVFRAIVTPRPTTTTTKRWEPPTTTIRRVPKPTQYVPFNNPENKIANIPTWLEWSRWIAEFWNALATTPEFWLRKYWHEIDHEVISTTVFPSRYISRRTVSVTLDSLCASY